MAYHLGTAMLWVVAAAVGAVLLIDQVRRWRQDALVRRFRARYGAAGRDLLLVYTASSHWQPHIEGQWLPRWGSRAVVLNRSAPWAPDTPEVALWRAVAGPVAHTPLAVVVPPRGPVQVVRFWEAFRDAKHGKPAKLQAAEAKLEAALAGRDDRGDV